MAVDVQGKVPDLAIPLTRVGVRNIAFPVTIKRGGREIFLSASTDIYIDIPHERKGADLSAMIDTTSHLVLKNAIFPGIENLTQQMARNILEELGYARHCEVTMSADYFVSVPMKQGRSLTKVILLGRTILSKHGEERDFIGIRAVGMNACPCTMEKERDRLKSIYTDLKAAIDQLPAITHNQRNTVEILIQKGGKVSIDAEKLVSVAQSVIGVPVTMGSESENEADLILRQHLNPMFVEDVVREIASRIKKEFSHLDGETLLSITSESEESVHPHNAFAEFNGKLKDITQE